MKKLLISFFVVFLSGCATYNPIPEGYSGPTSTISDSYSNKRSSSAHYFILTKVDGNTVRNSWDATRAKNGGRGTEFTPEIISREVPSKKQTFTIQGLAFYPTDAQSLIFNDMSIVKVVSFSPAENERYIVKGSLSKAGSDVWIEDSKGIKIEGSTN